MPNRESILDAFYTSLDASTGINLVVRETRSGFDFGESDYPACIIIAGEETKSRFAYGGGSTSTDVHDMQSEFMVGVAGFCRSVASTADLDTGRGDLIAAIDKARFKKPVYPGDQLIIKVEILKMLRGVSKAKAEAYVDGNLVAEAELLFTAVKV